MDIHPDNRESVDTLGSIVHRLEFCFARHFYKLRALDEVYAEGHPLRPEGMSITTDPVLPGAIFRTNFAVYPPVLSLGVEKNASPYMKDTMKGFIGCLNADVDPETTFGGSRKAENIQQLSQARIELTPENLKKIGEFIGFQSSFSLAEDEIAALASHNPELGAIAAEAAIRSIKAAMRSPDAERALEQRLNPHAKRVTVRREQEKDRAPAK